MTSNTPSAELVAHVQALVGDDVTAEQVNRVIVAYHAAHDGEPVGTVRMNPVTSEVAQRVDMDGVHKWRVLGVDGTLGFDTRPTLPDWDLVTSGAA
jgi:hypothetical protein